MIVFDDNAWFILSDDLKTLTIGYEEPTVQIKLTDKLRAELSDTLKGESNDRG